MGFDPNVPLVEDTTSSQDAQYSLPEPKNYIDDEESMRFCRDELVNLVRWTRTERRPMEDDWQQIRRMDQMIHDGGQAYKGRSNAYLPIATRNFDTLVSALSTGLFPSDDYMDVIDRQEGAIEDVEGRGEAAKKLKSYIMWEFEANAQLLRKMKPFFRQFAQYGNTVGKYRYKQTKQYSKREGRITFDEAGNIGGTMQAQDVEGFEFTARSIYNWHIYPLTAADLDEAILIFEDIDVPFTYIKDKVDAKEWPDTALSPTPIAYHDQNQQDLKTNFDVSATANSLNPTSEMGQMRTLTECWTYMRLPKSAYLPGEDTNCRLPVKVVIAGSEPIEIRRNPFWHQKPPYVVARMNVQPGFFYGQGFGKKVQPFQYLANDFANQTNDNGIYALNPIIKYNPAFLTGPLRPVAPGVTWGMTDPKGVVFEHPPTEQVQTGMQLMQYYIGGGQDFGGAPPILQGSKAAATATSSQILQRNASMPLQDIVKDLEMDVLVPLMRACWLLAQQFRSNDVMVAVMGEVIRITPRDLAIDAEFRSLASSQSINAQQRSQQALSFLQALENPANLQLLQQNGYQVNPEPVLSKVWSDGLGFRGWGKVVSKMPPQPMMPGPMGAPPGMPGQPPQPGQMPPPQPSGPPPGDRARSALEQVGQAPGEMVPGEGEAFGQVRDNADQLAAQQGGEPSF